MDDSSFPTPFAVAKFLLDDSLVMADYPVRYYSFHIRKHDTFNLKAMLRSITAFVILNDLNVRG